MAGGFRSVPVDRPEADDSLLDGGGHGANLAERLEAANGLARMINSGEPHPMDADHAMGTQEIVMAAYESNRLRDRATFPLHQDRYPLDVLLESGQLL